MTLVFWTSASADQISRTIGAALKRFRPEVPPHRFVDFNPDEVVVPDPGEVVLVCGNKPLDVLRKAGAFPKNRSLSSLREKPVTSPTGGTFMVTFDPNVVNNEPDK